MTNLKTFLSDESGAVTVDWVVLTAALVGLGLAVMGVVSSGVQTASNSISTQLGEDMIGTGFATTTTTTTTAGGGTETTTSNDGLDPGS